mgnify:CR=1 FL=1
MNCGCTVAAMKTSSKRKEIKDLIKLLKAMHPDIDQSIFTSASNVNLDQILGYYKGDQKVDFNQIYKGRKKTS